MTMELGLSFVSQLYDVAKTITFQDSLSSPESRIQQYSTFVNSLIKLSGANTTGLLESLLCNFHEVINELRPVEQPDSTVGVYFLTLLSVTCLLDQVKQASPEAHLQYMDDFIQRVCLPHLLKRSASVSKLMERESLKLVCDILSQLVVLELPSSIDRRTILDLCENVLRTQIRSMEGGPIASGADQYSAVSIIRLVIDILEGFLQHSKFESFVDFSNAIFPLALRMMITQKSSDSLTEYQNDNLLQQQEQELQREYEKKKSNKLLISSLLPALFNTRAMLATQKAGSEQQKRFEPIFIDRLKQLWEAVREMNHSGDSMRKTNAYALLCQFYDCFFKVTSSDNDNILKYCLDLRFEEDFWEMIQAGLVDPDTFTCKRSVYLLKRILDTSKENTNVAPQSTNWTKYFQWDDTIDLPHTQRQWEVFVVVYEGLDEHGLHLVLPIWSELVKIFPTMSNPEAVHGKTDKKKAPRKGGEAVAVGKPKAFLDFSWFNILFQKAFKHENFSVKRCALASVMGEIDFKNTHRLFVDMDFMCDTLITHTNDAKLFTNKNDTEFSQRMVNFYHNYFEALGSEEDRRRFVVRFIANLARPIVFSRPSLSTYLAILNSLSEGADLLGDDSIDCLRTILESNIQVHSLWIEVMQTSALLGALFKLAKPSSVSPVSVSRLLAHVNADAIFAQRASLTRANTEKWLNSEGPQYLYNGVQGMVEKYFSSSAVTSDNHINFSATMKDAERIAALFQFLLPSEISLGQTFSTLCSYAEKIYGHAYLDQSKKTQVLSLLDAILRTISRNSSNQTIKLEFLKLLFSASNSSTSGRPIDDVMSYIDSQIVYVDVFNNQHSEQNFTTSMHIENVDLCMSLVENILAIVRDVREQYGDINFSDEIALKILERSLNFINAVNQARKQQHASVASVPYFMNILCRGALCCVDALVAGWIPQQLSNEQLEHILSILVDFDMVRMNVSSRELPSENAMTQYPWTYICNQTYGLKWRSLTAVLRMLLERNNISIENLEQDHTVNERLHEQRAKLAPSFIALLTAVFEAARDNLGNVPDEDAVVVMRCLRLLIPIICIDRIDDGTFAHNDKLEDAIAAMYRTATEVYRRQAMETAATFVATLFQPALLLLPSLLSDNDSIFHEYFKRILKIGEQTPRVVPLLSLALGKLVTGTMPLLQIVTQFFIPNILTLLLFGDLPTEEEEYEACFNGLQFLPQSAEIKSAPPTFRADRIVRCAMVCSLRKLLQTFAFSTANQSPSETEVNTVRHAFFSKMVQGLLAMNFAPEINLVICMPNSVAHRQKLRIWQNLCLLTHEYIQACRASPEVNMPFATTLVQEINTAIWKCLELVNMISVKQLIETFTIYLAMEFPKLLIPHLKARIDDFNQRPQHVSSTVSIAGHLLLYSDPSRPEDEYAMACHELLPYIIALLSSHHHTIRLYAMTMLDRFWDRVERNEIPEELVRDIRHTMATVRRYFKINKECIKWIKKGEEGVLLANPRKEGEAFSIEALYVIPRNESNEKIYENIPLEVFESLSSVKHVVLSICSATESSTNFAPESILNNLVDFSPSDISTRSSIVAAFLELEEKKKKKKREAEEEKAAAAKEQEQEEQEADAEASKRHKLNFQRKILPWQNFHELESEVRPREKYREDTRNSESLKKRRSRPIIIVATFVDKIPNLAGLARTCEIFQAETLVMSNKKVIADPMFQQIAVSSERWCPIEEVKEDDLMDYLDKKKSEGYTIVGVEQTSSSVKLHEFTFPEKSVLLLGREREGIPVEYIQSIDVCVEIPQLGVIRSLNVHVSGAIMLFEQTRQMLLTSSSSSSSS